ncbi:hypothetical protein EG346_16965 [Chryseobacterium carnipullorum]|uniref:Uncharacterized protein n=1 Tax=Chryseobacterium carnipullorum TaxID=1124835 RepID=A0A3G6M8C4_CHRCU|nr:hypothetical protein [Chryseobacterium carnipullorum]AZA49766.1 hypothetical protein EG346_16965 [Chryseobacterium carnipullorum]AZA64658.1 hypothetical protein EG345_07995 [Chryseobacterium carnipullorum]
MSKTKYIKVAVSERLPEQSGNYFVFTESDDLKSGELMCTKDFGLFAQRFAKCPFPIKYFLEEVPDREQEMKEMLERKIELNIQTAKEYVGYCLDNNMENTAHS